MWPDSVGGTTVRFALTGIDNIDEINLSVAVGVVVRPVDGVFLVCQDTGFHHCVGGILIACIIVGLICRIAILIKIVSVVIQIPAECYRPEDIENGTVGTVGLVREILRSGRIAVVDGAVSRVAQFVENSLRMG